MTPGFLNARINKLWKWVLYLRANMGEGGGGNITSVNGDTGPDVVLTAEDVGALDSVETGDTPAIVLSGDGTSVDPLEANFASTASSNLNVEFVASNGALINGSVQAMSSEYGNTLQTKVSTIVAGDGVSVDDTDVKNPIISFTGGGVTSIQAGDNITVDNTDPANPIISSTGGGTELTAGSGIRIEGGEVKLGAGESSGGLVEPTFLMLPREGTEAFSLINIANSGIDVMSGKLADEHGMVRVTDNSTSMGLVHGGISSIGIVKSPVSQVVTMDVRDQLSSKGLTYADDYSANGTLDPRWIPDYGAVQALVENSINGGNQIEITEGDTTFPQGVLKLQQPIENTGYISISEDTAISLSDTASIHTINFIVGANSMTISEDGTTTPMNISAAAATQPTHLVTLNQLNNSLGSKLTASQGAAVADAVDESDVVTQFNALLASLRTAGIIAT